MVNKLNAAAYGGGVGNLNNAPYFHERNANNNSKNRIQL